MRGNLALCNHAKPSTRRWMCVLLSYALLPLPACADNTKAKKLPFAQTVAIANKGSLIDIDIDILISEEQLYAISLRFMFNEGNDKDYARVRRLIGGVEKDAYQRPLKTGEPLTLSLRKR